MPTPDLPPELWLRVLSFLRKPLPKALSECPRSELRQSDLCAAARVCRTFSSACTTLLYTHIVTDQFPFLVGTNIPTRRRLFRHTRSLRIEYGEKGGSPQYKDIIKKGQWAEIGRSREDYAVKVITDCAAEVSAIANCLKYLLASGGFTDWFPRLESIAVASIYGDHLSYWRKYEIVVNDAPANAKPLISSDSSEIFYKLLSSARIKHLCVRDIRGPLGLPPLTTATMLPTPSFTRTVHFPHVVQDLHLPLGHNVRWISDAPSTASCSDTFRSMSLWVLDAIELRQQGPAATGGRWGRDKVDLEIYSHHADMLDPRDLPSHPITRQEKELKAGREFASETQKLFRDESGLLDRVTWYPSSVAVACPACGSRPPP